MSNATQPTNSKKSPYKPTDFRHKMWINERKTLRCKAKQRSFRVEYDEAAAKCNNLLTVTVDTSKARSNIDVLRLCLKELNWREYHFGSHSTKCDIHWNSVTFNSDDCQMPKSGKINKFPGMADVLLKVNLGRVLDVMQRLYPDHYDFHPRQWFLPQQMAELMEDARKCREAHKCYIVKPDDGSQGDGIQLLSEPSQLYLEQRKQYIAQEYICQPLLLDKLKFDLRVYAVLTNLDPVEVHICREGLARFCTEPYAQPTTSNLSQTYMHLTNYSLNKFSSSYEHTSSGDDGSKRTLSGVLQRLARMGHDVVAIQQRIELLVVKTFMAIVPDLKLYHRVELPASSQSQLSCFQIVGFDILLKEDGCPVLLEVNSKPSLRIDYEAEVAPGICQSFYSYVDEKIKKALLVDTLLLVAPTQRKRSKKTGEPYEVTKHKGYDTLQQILPSKYGKQFDDVCLMQKIADIFVNSLGIRGHVRMGPTAFRTFASRCCFPEDQKNSNFGFTNAAFDIMFIDLQRRWEHMNNGISYGLCLQAFVEAFLQLAQRVSPNLSLPDATQSMVEQYRPAQIRSTPNTVHLPRIRDAGRTDLKQDKRPSVSEITELPSINMVLT